MSQARKAPKFWGIHARPSGRLKVILGILPFLIFFIGYGVVSELLERRASPSARFFPTISKISVTAGNLALKRDVFTRKYLMVNDTWASLKRVVTGVSVGAATGLVVGMHIGLFPGLKALVFPSFAATSIVPPWAIMAILFYILGMGELTKATLLFLFVFYAVAADISNATEKFPQELKTKALTLGASQLRLIYSIVRPQMMPRMIETSRIALRTVWNFLIAAEMLSASAGLGHRIYIVQRNNSLAVIITYVMLITLIGYFTDRALDRLNRWKYDWYFAANE